MMLSLLLAHSVNFITLPYDPISLLIVMVTFAVNAILIAHYETTRAMFETQSKMYHQELQEINNTLEVKIEKEIQKGQKKDALLSMQSKMAGMGEMLGHISHQWKQPLATLSIIQTNLRMQLELQDLEDESILNNITDAELQIEYMNTTMKDFLNYYNKDQCISSFTFETLMKRTTNFLSSTLKLSSIELTLHNPDDVKLHTYENAMMQVLINLISNAKEALLAQKTVNPTIYIEAKLQADNIIITVQDNAGGIDPSIIDFLFQAHFTTKAHGNGLGLYMSHEIVTQRMHGTLSVINNNNGALFTIIVPYILL
jgi:two-component system, NtrC family, C4-dicarboxylate transport sensor histidine kinase DctB